MEKEVTEGSSVSARRYVYDGQEILVEYDGSNNILARYTHSGLRTDDVMSVYVTSSGESAGLAQSSGSYYYGKDALGSISVVADSGGNKLQRYVYGAFGTLENIKDGAGNDITSAPVLNTSYAFTGREYDKESGLYYYRARYYNASVGRFLQRDPEPGKLKRPLTVINSYTYVANNPQNYIDPTGKGFLSIVGGFFAGLAVASVLATTVVLATAILAPTALSVALFTAGAMTLGGAIGGAVAVANNNGIFSWKEVWKGVCAGTAIGGILGGAIGGELFPIPMAEDDSKGNDGTTNLPTPQEDKIESQTTTSADILTSNKTIWYPEDAIKLPRLASD